MSAITVHHVELCKNPIPVPKEDKQVFFDECNKQLVSVTGRGAIACTYLEGEKRGVRSTYSVNRQEIINAKFSPDQKYLAVQFSPVDIEFTNLEDNTTFVQSFKSKKSKGNILSFFWTYSDNFLVIMTGTIDIYQFPKPPKSKDGLKLLSDQKVNAGWFHYSARHRIALISPPFTPTAPTSSTPPHSSISSPLPVFSYYFKPNKIIKMPRFDVDSEGTGPLTDQEVVVHQLYDAIYCIHVHSRRKELVLYQLTKEAVIPRTRLDLLTAGTSYIHIVDNLLLVHNNTSRVTMMFDVKSKKDMGSFPVASPLPLSPIPYEPPPDATYLTEPLLPQPMDTRALPHTTSMNPFLYSDSWTYHLPNYIVDRNAELCWSVGLNLDGIVQSLTNDRCRMTEFLLRRTRQVLPRTKKVLLRELLAMVVEHESLAVVEKVFDSINGVLAAQLREGLLDASSSSPHIHTRYTIAAVTRGLPGGVGVGREKGEYTEPTGLDAEWTAEQVETLEATDPDDGSGSASSLVAPSLSSSFSSSHSYTQPQAHQPSSALRIGDAVVSITQADMYTHVFMPIEERDPPLLDTKYVVGVITEYIRSLNFHHVTVTPFLYELLINFLVSNCRWYQLHQFLQYHVVSDSTHVACQLLSLESKYPPAYQLALDMMKRLSTHEQIVEVLISKNLLLQALRFMKSHRVKIPPKRVLEAAVQLRDNTILFHVYKFFESRKELTEDCEKYVHLARKIFGDQKISR